MKEKLGVGCVLALVLALVLSAVGGAIALAMLIEVDDTSTAVVGAGPFAGQSDAIVDITGASDGTRDGDVIARRLEALGVRSDVKSAAYGWIQIELDDVRGRDAIEPLLAIGRFEVCLVLADQSALSEERLGALPPQVTRTHTATGRLTLRAPSEDAFAPAIAMLPTVTTRTFCGNDGCELVIVDAAALSSHDITRATAGVDADANAIVSLELDSNGTSRLETLTSAHVGEEIALVLDGRVLAMPVVTDTIANGRLSFVVTQPERAHTVAAILTTKEELYGVWTITSFVEEP